MEKAKNGLYHLPEGPLPHAVNVGFAGWDGMGWDGMGLSSAAETQSCLPLCGRAKRVFFDSPFFFFSLFSFTLFLAAENKVTVCGCGSPYTSPRKACEASKRLRAPFMGSSRMPLDSL